MKKCSDCRYSFIRDHGNKHHRLCSKFPGNPICINARQFYWNYQNRARECGPDGKEFDQK